MCLAVPARVLEVSGDIAVVELAEVRREISVMLLEGVAAGDWLIVHAGFAIERLSEEEAASTLSLLREIAGAAETH
jgi:hydrogenase expression/formation protein HypC